LPAQELIRPAFANQEMLIPSASTVVHQLEVTPLVGKWQRFHPDIVQLANGAGQ
jgi:hypothetical protein